VKKKERKGEEKPRGLLEKIQRDAFESMSWAKARSSNLYVETKPLKKGQVIQARHQKITIEQETIMVFADDAPLYNWAHPCRYLLYDAKSGRLYKEVKASFPPYLVEPPETYQAFHKPVAFMRPEKWRIEKYPRWDKVIGDRLRWYIRGKRYAVLFSGGSNNRHVNDLEFLYRTLIEVYDFSPDRIYVLNYDGTINYSGGPKPVGNWPGDNTPYRMLVNAAGIKSELVNVFDDLKGRLKRHDFLLIHTNNHGGHNGTESYLCGQQSPGYIAADDYMASDFAAKLSELPRFAQLMVMMEQCHSGGFNAPIIANSPADETTVASACEEDKSSNGGPEFDPFARDWIAAVTGADPYGAALAFDPDTNGDGVISASEAFDYADVIKDPYDTPVYDETPTGCGDDMHLGRPEPIYIFKKIEKYLRLYEIGPPWPPPVKEPPIIFEKLIGRIGEIEKLIRQR
jgi:hypothetical protein